VIQTPQALGEEYWRELRELVDHGEISATLAKQITDDMFEQSAPGEPPRLRRSYWRTYLKEIIGDYS
jgi:polyhydroxyalkanoate synthesis regulator phasin